ncbi:PREDICTED: uncharacterized protein LOC101810511 [Ficedula albicollis]|uniref:uncharacterized protein LOC101810511 n=1 Tax=Ficedula albicollis TaxID=59894 RepID=UPI0007AD8CFC|nr:PREDICTED: uncharacterized protein LOC101810511 [Ficedula albicollis]
MPVQANQTTKRCVKSSGGEWRGDGERGDTSMPRGCARVSQGEPCLVPAPTLRAALRAQRHRERVLPAAAAPQLLPSCPAQDGDVPTGCRARDGAVPAAPTSCPSSKSGKRRLIPCLVRPAICWHRCQLPKGITERGGEGAIPGPLRSSGKGLAACWRGHGSGGIRSCLRLPTPNPFATFRLAEAIGSGRRKGVPRAGAGASEAQPKVGGRGCAEPKLRRLQTLSIPHRSRLPPAQRWSRARRAAGPRRLRAGGDRESRSGDGLPAASPLWQLRSGLCEPGSELAAHPWGSQSRCPAPGGSWSLPCGEMPRGW